MNTLMSRPIVLFCIIMALLFASCKKDQGVTDQTANGNAGAPLTGRFKKEVVITDAAQQGKMTLLISGNDEQAVNAIAASEFSTSEPATAKNGSPATIPAPLAQPLPKPDPAKAVIITIRSVEGFPLAKNTPWLWFRLTAQAGFLSPQIMINADLDPGVFQLRRNLLSSFSNFGISGYIKAGGNASEPFGMPWGDTGFPLLNASTDPNGVFCQRLYTVLAVSTVNQQWLAFQTFAWPL